MPVQGYIPVREASKELGVTEARVRALLDTQHLDGYKLGGRWLVRGESVRRRQRAGAHRGRVLSPKNAWAVLQFASGEPADFISARDARRLLHLLDARGLRRLAPRLRSRAERHDLVVHPGVLGSLAKHHALMLTGVSASLAHDLKLAAGSEVDAYVSAVDLKRLRNAFKLRPAEDGRANVRLRVLKGLPPRRRQRYAPFAVVALDLAEEPDVRSSQIGKRALGQLDRERRWRTLGRRTGAARRPRQPAIS